MPPMKDQPRLSPRKSLLAAGARSPGPKLRQQGKLSARTPLASPPRWPKSEVQWKRGHGKIVSARSSETDPGRLSWLPPPEVVETLPIARFPRPVSLGQRPPRPQRDFTSRPDERAALRRRKEQERASRKQQAQMRKFWDRALREVDRLEREEEEEAELMLRRSRRDLSFEDREQARARLEQLKSKATLTQAERREGFELEKTLAQAKLAPDPDEDPLLREEAELLAEEAADWLRAAGRALPPRWELVSRYASMLRVDSLSRTPALTPAQQREAARLVRDERQASRKLPLPSLAELSGRGAARRGSEGRERPKQSPLVPPELTWVGTPSSEDTEQPGQLRPSRSRLVPSRGPEPGSRPRALSEPVPGRMRTEAPGWEEPSPGEPQRERPPHPLRDEPPRRLRLKPPRLSARPPSSPSSRRLRGPRAGGLAPLLSMAPPGRKADQVRLQRALPRLLAPERRPRARPPDSDKAPSLAQARSRPLLASPPKGRTISPRSAPALVGLPGPEPPEPPLDTVPPEDRRREDEAPRLRAGAHRQAKTAPPGPLPSAEAPVSVETPWRRAEPKVRSRKTRPQATQPQATGPRGLGTQGSRGRASAPRSDRVPRLAVGQVAPVRSMLPRVNWQKKARAVLPSRLTEVKRLPSGRTREASPFFLPKIPDKLAKLQVDWRQKLRARLPARYQQPRHLPSSARGAPSPMFLPKTPEALHQLGAKVEKTRDRALQATLGSLRTAMVRRLQARREQRALLQLPPLLGRHRAAPRTVSGPGELPSLPGPTPQPQTTPGSLPPPVEPQGEQGRKGPSWSFRGQRVLPPDAGPERFFVRSPPTPGSVPPEGKQSKRPQRARARARSAPPRPLTTLESRPTTEPPREWHASVVRPRKVVKSEPPPAPVEAPEQRGLVDLAQDELVALLRDVLEGRGQGPELLRRLLALLEREERISRLREW